MIPELPEIISGFASCYPKFPNKIRVSGISGSGSGIPGSGFGLRVFCPALPVNITAVHVLGPTIPATSDAVRAGVRSCMSMDLVTGCIRDSLRNISRSIDDW